MDKKKMKPKEFLLYVLILLAYSFISGCFGYFLGINTNKKYSVLDKHIVRYDTIYYVSE